MSSSSSSSSDVLLNGVGMTTVGASTARLVDVECGTSNTANTGGCGVDHQLSALETSPPNASLNRLRTEFSLIVRTLSVLQRLEDTEETSSVVNLFKSLTEVIHTFPPLSLSAYWFGDDTSVSTVLDGSSTIHSSCLVAKPVSLKDKENKHQLTHDKDDPHDPLHIVQFAHFTSAP